MDIRLLFLELSNIKPDEFIDSDEEVNPKIDVVVGPMTDHLKRLYTVLQQTRKSAAELLKGLPAISNESESRVSRCKACEMNQKATLLRFLFRQSVRDEYKLWGDCGDGHLCPGIGVRKGFLVVRPANSVKKEMPDVIIVRIFGEPGSSQICLN